MRIRRNQFLASGLWLGCVSMMLSVFSGCTEGLMAGEVGVARYFGEAREDDVARFLAPSRDRYGNAYVALTEEQGGACSLVGTSAVIVHRDGGTAACAANLREDQRRVHGWVGYTENQAMLWTGNALVVASGADGTCTPILDTDPNTRADINFLGVIPWVWDRPTRRTMVALISSPGDDSGLHVTVDIDRSIYSNARPFEPLDATDLRVVGTGGNLRQRTGVYWVNYTQGETNDDTTEIRVGEAIFVDENGDTYRRVTVPNIADLDEDDVQGFIALDDDGVAVGMLSDGTVLAVGASSVQAVTADFSPTGIHSWEGQTYAVGVTNDQAVLAQVSEGVAQSSSLWASSNQATSDLNGTIDVIDDRNIPREFLNWSDTETALGDATLVSEQSLQDFSDGSAGWLIRGPSFVSGNGFTCRSIGFLPIGVEYP